MAVVKIADLDRVVSEILDEYSGNIAEATKKTVEKVAETAKKEVQANAPKRTGKYRSGWAVRKETDRLHSEAVVHNRTRYQLAHLLEKGHAKRGGGRVKAYPHIAQAEQNAVRNMEEALRKIAENG